MVNVGDKVNILSVGGSSLPVAAIGQEGIVRSVNALRTGATKPWLDVMYDGFLGLLRDDQWELPQPSYSQVQTPAGVSPVNPTPKFSVGDRVQLIRDEPALGVSAGDGGTVLARFAGSPPTCAVLMDDGTKLYLFERDLAPAAPQTQVQAVAAAQAMAAPQTFSASVPWSTVTVDWTEIVRLSDKIRSACECGSDKVGSPAHSHWCPKHEAA